MSACDNQFVSLGCRWRWSIFRVNAAWYIVIKSRAATLEMGCRGGSYDDAKHLVDAQKQVMDRCPSLGDYLVYLSANMNNLDVCVR